MKQRKKKITEDNTFRNILNEGFIKIFDDDEAALSHFLNINRDGLSKSFEEAAHQKIKHLLNNSYAHEEITTKAIEDALQYMMFNLKEDIPFPAPENPKFTFIDLFAGIGGFRIALQDIGGKCIFTSEWDNYAKKTYQANFGEVPFGDITKERTKKFIPEHFDVLCAGFPCQAFSIAGRKGGFKDTRGTLFFDVAEIIRRHKPKAFFLENVKGLTNHDRGKTLRTILNVLRNDLNYYVPEPEIINAKDFGVPQNRERIFIVGFRNDLGISSFKYPDPINPNTTIKDIMEKEEVSVKYYLSTQYLETLRKHRARHESKGNGFGFEIRNITGTATAIVCGGMGRERNLIIDNRLKNFKPVTRIKGKVNREGVRKMTPREWARLQGYPDKFIIVVSDGQAYKQFGNSVAVPAIKATASQIIKQIVKKD